MEKDLAFQVFYFDRLICDKYTDLSCKYYFDKDKNHLFYALSPKDGQSIEDYLEDRVFPKERVDCKAVLKELGLHYYDVVSIAKETCGYLYGEAIWIKFPNTPEKTLKDVIRKNTVK